MRHFVAVADLLSEAMPLRRLLKYNAHTKPHLAILSFSTLSSRYLMPQTAPENSPEQEQSSTTLNTSEQVQQHLGKGIAFMMTGSVLFAIADALGKLVTQGYPLSQVVWLRSVFGLMLIALVILANGKPRDFKTSRPLNHLIRSLVGISMTVCILVGLKYIPLAEVTSLVFATPLVVAVYSITVLKEPMNKGMLMAIILGLVGVIIVVRPTPDHFHIAHLVMLGFVLSSAYLSISARALVKTESALTLNFYIYPATIIAGAWFAWRDWVTPDFQSLAMMFGVAFFATLALLSITKAVHCASPAKVTPFDYSRIIWTLALGFLFWGELPDSVTWIGIAVIIMSGLYIISKGRTVKKAR